MRTDDTDPELLRRLIDLQLEQNQITSELLRRSARERQKESNRIGRDIETEELQGSEQEEEHTARTSVRTISSWATSTQQSTATAERTVTGTTVREQYEFPDERLSPEQAFPEGRQIYVINKVTPAGRKANEGDRKGKVNNIEYKHCKWNKVEIRVWFKTVNGKKTYRFPEHLKVLVG